MAPLFRFRRGGQHGFKSRHDPPPVSHPTPILSAAELHPLPFELAPGTRTIAPEHPPFPGGRGGAGSHLLPVERMPLEHRSDPQQSEPLHVTAPPVMVRPRLS